MLPECPVWGQIVDWLNLGEGGPEGPRESGACAELSLDHFNVVEKSLFPFSVFDDDGLSGHLQ